MYDLVTIGNPLYHRISHVENTAELKIFHGCSINSSLIASRLGIDNTVIVGCLENNLRELAIKEFEQWNMPEYLIIDSDSSNAAAISSRLLGNQRKDLFVAQGTIRIKDVPDEFLKSRVILLCPSVQDINLELIEWIADSSDAEIILDTQGLFRVAKSRGQAGLFRDTQCIRRILELVQITKHTHEESIVITGEKDPLLSAELLVQWGCEISIITMGMQGNIVFDGEEFLIVPIYDALLKDDTIVRDGFTSGFVVELLKQGDITQCSVYASVIASMIESNFNKDFNMDQDEISKRFDVILNQVEVR